LHCYSPIQCHQPDFAETMPLSRISRTYCQGAQFGALPHHDISLFRVKAPPRLGDSLRRRMHLSSSRIPNSCWFQSQRHLERNALTCVAAGCGGENRACQLDDIVITALDLERHLTGELGRTRSLAHAIGALKIAKQPGGPLNQRPRNSESNFKGWVFYLADMVGTWGARLEGKSCREPVNNADMVAIDCAYSSGNWTISVIHICRRI